MISLIYGDVILLPRVLTSRESSYITQIQHFPRVRFPADVILLPRVLTSRESSYITQIQHFPRVRFPADVVLYPIKL